MGNKSQSFLKFKAQLISNGVSGKDLVNLNDFSLKMMGLKNNEERNVIIQHLNKLLIHSKQTIKCQNMQKEPNDIDNKEDVNDIDIKQKQQKKKNYHYIQHLKQKETISENTDNRKKKIYKKLIKNIQNKLCFFFHHYSFFLFFNFVEFMCLLF